VLSARPTTSYVVDRSWMTNTTPETVRMSRRRTRARTVAGRIRRPTIPDCDIILFETDEDSRWWCC